MNENGKKLTQSTQSSQSFHGQAISNSLWYVAAMNNWTARDLTIDLSQFLTTEMNMDSFSDGMNAYREATDYKHVSRKVTPSDKLTVHLAPAGGWTARFF